MTNNWTLTSPDDRVYEIQLDDHDSIRIRTINGNDFVEFIDDSPEPRREGLVEFWIKAIEPKDEPMKFACDHCQFQSKKWDDMLSHIQVAHPRFFNRNIRPYFKS
jgi:hypothetical protein